ncbi:MAG TPA: corrinoid protein [Bacillota bacterium]|jgi:5-methyltetrahydrofolate--homocysteine methyltransferase
MTTETLQRISDAVQRGDAKVGDRLTREALAGGTAPGIILTQGLLTAMATIGARFKAEEVFISEVLMASMAMKAAMGVLRPLLSAGEVQTKGTFLLGTVKGDLHDMGKNLVAAMVEGAGFTVVDLGVNVPPERFVQAIVELRPRLVGLSALLTTTMPWMKKTIEAIDRAGLRESVRVFVGGAPVTQDFADRIGADFYAPDAASAAELAVRAAR